MTLSTSFDDWMRNVQSTMEETLSRLLPEGKLASSSLHESMRYAVLDGGKRIRPLLVFATGNIFGTETTTLARSAAAVEMIHAYSLVHDDMPCMDNDVLRRGKPTVHVEFGEATALLAGDALQAQAFIVLSNQQCDPVLIVEMMRLLSHAAGAAGMCGGQAIDLASVGKSLAVKEIENMHRLKTGALLTASVFLGAYCSKIPTEQEKNALNAYAKAIGLAFQVVDDILDVTADSADLGKTAGKDNADNKPTYVSLLGLEESRQLAEKLRNDAYTALSIFDEKADYLRQLADLVVRRKK